MWGESIYFAGTAEERSVCRGWGTAAAPAIGHYLSTTDFHHHCQELERSEVLMDKLVGEKMEEEVDKKVDEEMDEEVAEVGSGGISQASVPGPPRPGI